MFNNLFRSKPPSPPSAGVAGPYSQSEMNVIYHLLFCDDPTLFRPKPETQPAAWQSVLFSDTPDSNAIRGLAEDPSQETRCRILAYNWLRLNQFAVDGKELLAVIIEVPLERGLDVLAAYADGRIRYINQTGKLAVFETSPPNVGAQAGKLLAAGRVAIAKIGPWDRPRLPAPGPGKIRLTFLVSDGLYFGEGPLPGMDRDPIAAPIILEGGALVNLVVEAVLSNNK